MKTTHAFLLALAAFTAGCGGGGGNSDPAPPPPPPSQALAISLEATGSIRGMGTSAVPSGLLLINSLAEYDALYAGAGMTGPL